MRGGANTEAFYVHPLLPYLECRRSTNSGRHYREHTHSAFSVGAIDEGSVSFKVGSELGTLAPGELVLIDPDVLHYCNPSGPGLRNYYVLYLAKPWCAEVQNSLWGAEAFRPVRACVLRDRAVYDRFVAAMELLLGAGELLEKEQAIHELAEELFAAAEGVPVPRDSGDLDVDAAKETLASDLDRSVTLAEAAAAHGANPFTFLRRFKAAADVTPHAYRMSRRIERAKELLRQGADISGVALDCGFCDQSHFTRVFKAVTAVTPREYAVNFIQ